MVNLALIESIPLDQIVVAASLLAVPVMVLVEMAKQVGLAGSRQRSAAAVLVGQILALAHWWTVWAHTGETLFYAILVGIAASAMAMQLWDRAIKRFAAPKPPVVGK